MKGLAPIVLFVYNRPEEVRRTINSLQNNFLAQQSELFVFSDGPKNSVDKNNVERVRKYLQQIGGFKKVQVIESPENKGLSNSIINGVTEIIERYGKVIVLEDDLITSPNFLDYMNQALDYYEDKSKIMSVNGYSLDVESEKYNSDVYFHPRTYSWGWGTWEDCWNEKWFLKDYIVDNLSRIDKEEYTSVMGEDALKMLRKSISGLNDSWYARWIFLHFIEGKISVYPFLSKVKNIGFSEKGTHCKSINVHQINFDKTNKRNFSFPSNISVNKDIDEIFLKYFSNWYKIIYRIQLLKKSEGRKLLYEDLWQKLKYRLSFVE